MKTLGPKEAELRRLRELQADSGKLPHEKAKAAAVPVVGLGVTGSKEALAKYREGGGLRGLVERKKAARKQAKKPAGKGKR